MKNIVDWPILQLLYDHMNIPGQTLLSHCPIPSTEILKHYQLHYSPNVQLLQLVRTSRYIFHFQYHQRYWKSYKSPLKYFLRVMEKVPREKIA